MLYNYFQRPEYGEQDFKWESNHVGVAAVDFRYQVPGCFVYGVAGGETGEVVAGDVAFEFRSGELAKCYSGRHRFRPRFFDLPEYHVNNMDGGREGMRFVHEFFEDPGGIEFIHRFAVGFFAHDRHAVGGDHDHVPVFRYGVAPWVIDDLSS